MWHLALNISPQGENFPLVSFQVELIRGEKYLEGLERISGLRRRRSSHPAVLHGTRRMRGRWMFLVVSQSVPSVFERCGTRQRSPSGHPVTTELQLALRATRKAPLQKSQPHFDSWRAEPSGTVT